MDFRQQTILLKVVRDSVTAAVNKWIVAVPVSDEKDLAVKCGCFVTLKNSSRLRGCIGQFTSGKPLIELVSEMAIAAAVNDARFLGDPITVEEIDNLEFEISVLSPLEKSDDPSSLRLGIDGIYIVQGHKSGCFLPQVATEAGWTEKQFLTYCCVQKAGLDPEAWRDPQTVVYLFTAECFSAQCRDII
jgi:hypothetical protein